MIHILRPSENVNPSNPLSICLKSIVLSSLLFVFTSGIIRHDRTIEEHLALAKEQQFDCVGIVRSDSNLLGSCVLIDEETVLTAAHLLVKSKIKNDTMELKGGKRYILYIPVGKSVIQPETLLVTFSNGSVYNVDSIIIHPAYLDSNSARGFCDLALLKLSKRVGNIKPANLNSKFDEKGALVYGVGYGASGFANKPDSIQSNHLKIVGTNIIDVISGESYLGSYITMTADFDHPIDTTYNTMGEPTPTEYEYVPTGGDSGGGLFRYKDGSWGLIGIAQSATIGTCSSSSELGYYGSSASWTRISVFYDWIQSN